MAIEFSSSAVITFKFDTTNFKDKDNYYINFPEQKYQVINAMSGESGFNKLLSAFAGLSATITSNGIETDTYGNVITSFNIEYEKFLNTKIPIVIRIKGNKNNYVKSIGKLRLNQEVILTLEDTSGNTITDGVSFYEDFGVMEDDANYSGFFRGYMICSKDPGKDVKIKAYINFLLGEQILIDTKECIFGRPASTDLNVVLVQNKIGSKLKTAQYKTNNISGLSGIYSSCMVSYRKPDNTLQKYGWVADADTDTVVKFSFNNFDIIEEARIDLKTITLSASPSHMCADINQNVWVCLYDSLSTIRINNTTNAVDKTINPYHINTIVDSENKLRPASIDVDVENNIWICYSSDDFSIIEKYDSSGTYIGKFSPQESSLSTLTGYQLTELVTDIESNCYVVGKSPNGDVIFKIKKDLNEGTIYKYNVGGKLWNINLDLNNNIWATKDINKVIRIFTNNVITEFSLPTLHSDNSSYYLSDLEGIACNTDGNILVIDDSRKGLYYFDSSSTIETFEPKFLRINSTNIPIANKLNGYGDWNGFRYINKYQHIYSTRYELSTFSGDIKFFNVQSKIKNIKKVNENFDPIEQIKSYRFQEYLLDKNIFFDEFLGTCIGTLSSDSGAPGKVIYERIANFFDNNVNVDTCGALQLRSMNNLLDEDVYAYNSKTFNMPPDMLRAFDLLTVKYSKLRGSRNKYDNNFNDRGYISNVSERDNVYGMNKGVEIDFNTYIVDVNKPLVAYEKFSETYKFINTKISQISLSSNNVVMNLVPFDVTNTKYPLSAYDTRWGGGLVLPENINTIKWKIPEYYSFFEYVSGFDNKSEYTKNNGVQTEGIINWSDLDNSISEEDIKDFSNWDDVKTDIIKSILVKGLSTIK